MTSNPRHGRSIIGTYAEVISGALLFLVMAFVLRETKGYNHPWVWLMFGSFSLWALTAWPERRHQFVAPALQPERRWAQLLLCITLLLSLHWTNRHAGLMYWESSPWRQTFQATTAVAFIPAILLVFKILFPTKFLQRISARLLFTISAATIMVALALIPAMSPKPFIDVFLSNTLGIQYLLSGTNPYSAAYPDIYQGIFDYKLGFLYFPGTLLLQTIAYVAGNDIRFAMMTAHVVSAWLITRIANSRTHTNSSWLLAAAWLWFPVVFFVSEQAWSDPLLVAAAALMILALERGQFKWAGMIAGAALATKQYALLLPFLGFIWLWRAIGFRDAWRFAVSGAVTFALVVGPFVIWDFQALYDSTIANQANPGMRADAMTIWNSLIKYWGFEIPKSLTTLTTIGCIAGGGLVTWMLGKRGLPALTYALVLTYGGTFFFGKWAFCNYYYFLAGLVALHLCWKLPRPDQNVI